MDDTSTLRSELQGIDEAIAKLEADIELGEQLKRLKANPDYIAVIAKGYIESEANKLFNILTEPTGVTPYTSEQLQLKLAAISDLKGYVGSDEYVGSVETAAKAAPATIERERLYRQDVTSRYSMNTEDK